MCSQGIQAIEFYMTSRISCSADSLAQGQSWEGEKVDGVRGWVVDGPCGGVGGGEG